MQIKATEVEKVTPNSTLQVGEPALCCGGEGMAVLQDHLSSRRKEQPQAKSHWLCSKQKKTNPPKPTHKECFGVSSIPSGTSILMTMGAPKPGVYMEGPQLAQPYRHHSAQHLLPSSPSLASSSQGHGCIAEAHTNKSNPITLAQPRLADRSQFVIELHQTSCMPLALCKITHNLSVHFWLTRGIKPNSTEVY